MFLFGCCLSLSISSDILRSLPVVCCFEVLCSFHTQTAFLSCSELWPGPDGEGPDMPLIKAECVSVSVCEAAHKPPSTSPSNYTKWCLRSSLSTHYDSWIIREVHLIFKIFYICVFFGVLLLLWSINLALLAPRCTGWPWSGNFLAQISLIKQPFFQSVRVSLDYFLELFRLRKLHLLLFSDSKEHELLTVLQIAHHLQNLTETN